MTDKVMAFRNEPTRKTGPVRILVIRGRTPVEFFISWKEARELQIDLSSLLIAEEKWKNKEHD